ncbi:MAG TPA: hypothetical protein VFC51_10025 [Chloroflexota bacterium]|nr:hypothetical protein [Chloroflexota bacterium]
MVSTASPPTSFPVSVPVSSVAVAVQFALAVSSREAVARLAYSGADDREIGFWIFLNRDDPKETEELFAIAHRVQKKHAGSLLIRLHVVPPRRIDESALPQLETLFTRP